MFIKTHSYTTHIQIFLVVSFSFVNKPSSDLFHYDDCPMKHLGIWDWGLSPLHTS